MKEGEKPQEKVAKVNKGGVAKRSDAIPKDFAGPTKPSYSLCCTNDGHVYAKFVVSYDEYIAWSIGSLRPLLLTQEDPFVNWYLKPSIDSM